jgi:hypothetical protein
MVVQAMTRRRAYQSIFVVENISFAVGRRKMCCESFNIRTSNAFVSLTMWYK